ncbi:hypothetical protein [Longirhabdus pacifica]|uniref:hypothetical protein n=1 Tax=Longirhabdus pacifica TaxID=2305227 RepID=UPI00100919A9|nr:hypothetical protein [Longirhabdus pacifica]
MSYCTHCGEKLDANTKHHCNEIAATSESSPIHTNSTNTNSTNDKTNTNALNEKMKDAIQQVDKNKLVDIIRNPIGSLTLTKNDMVYGIIGIAASVLSFSFLGFAAGNKLGALTLYFYDVNEFLIAMRFLLLGVISIAALLGMMFLFGNRFGSKKYTWKESLTSLGAIQTVFAAGFLLSGLLGFFAANLSLFILSITCLSALSFTVLFGVKFFSVKENKLFLFVILSITGYLLIVYILTQLVII